jgi:hypothetical protein
VTVRRLPDDDQPSPGTQLPPWWIEAVVVLAGYLAYQLVQITVTGSEHSAVDRAGWLWSAERRLHLDPEVALNHLLSGSHGLIVVAGFYYGTLHFILTPCVLAWLRWRRSESYIVLRNTLVGASVAALLVYWLLPLAPPRLAIPGVTDTLKVNNILSAGSPTFPASLANQYAAMPSLHVAWAVWVALAVVVAFPAARFRHLAWVYPALTTIDVMATGNHFLADALAGALLVAVLWLFSNQGLRPGPGILRERAPSIVDVSENRKYSDGLTCRRDSDLS